MWLWIGMGHCLLKTMSLMKTRMHSSGCKEKITLLSFCGYNREKDVRRLAQQLHFPFDSINFTRERKGEGGKADWMLWKGHDIIFEDQMDIIEECSEKGIWVYVVAARSNRDCKFPRYQTFGDAVDAFLAYSSP